MEEKVTIYKEYQNLYSNNNICFCYIIEQYITFCNTIKISDIGLFCNTIKEICIIFEVPAILKSKSIKAKVSQVYIINTNTIDPILQKAYLANILVNLKDMPQIFYEINFLLEDQNGKFKRFWANHCLFLWKINKIFQLYALLVDILKNIRFLINQIVIGRKRQDYYPQKDTLFNIMNLANQLYKLKSTLLNSAKYGKIYFPENQIPDLIKQG